MKNFIITILTVVFLAGISSCVKEKFTAPADNNTDPNITVNSSIATIKALYNGVPAQITQDYVISAIVVGDDRSGNLYKSLAIEDATGGITLSIVGSDLYTTMPVGRRLFIKLKGLYVAQYSGSYQIVAYVNGDGTLGGIPTSTLANYIFPGTRGNTVTPIVTTLANIAAPNNSLQSELIELDNVEFSPADRNQMYADNVNLISVSHLLEDCGTTVHNAAVYTSGYANFASAHTPSGNGKVICIYGVYNGATQLTIRDTTDLSLTGPACH